MALRREYQDALTRLVIDDTLLHRVSMVVETGQDDWGEPIFGTATDIKCFATGSSQRVQLSATETITASWEVLFDRGTPIKIGDKLTNCRDRDGDMLFEELTIRLVNDQISPERGREIRTAVCS